jgi:hypothetical protein
MKKYLIFLALLCVGISACKKDDPCENITCLNGGTCANGSCNCPTGYSGSDCSQQVKPTRINIQSITVTDFQPTDSNGAGWDVFDGADAYAVLSLNGNVIASNENSRIEDVTNSPFSWSSLPSGFEMDDVTNQYQLSLYDYDDGLTADDFMGGIIFTPYNSTNGFPEKITVSCGNCSVAFELKVDYDF